MSLKSGILSESTWALDTLNILLHDDRTVGFFYLKHHHSLLNTLIDHFRQCLVSVFGDHFDTLPKYFSDFCGEKLKVSDGKGPLEEHLTKERLLGAIKSDSEVVSSEKNDDTPEDRLIPISSVFDFGEENLRLGRSNDLSHVQVSFADDDMFFPSASLSPEMVSLSTRRKLEKNSRLLRIDVTPLSDLLRREALLDQIPLPSHSQQHQKRRGIRSPRKPERNTFEDLGAQRSDNKINQTRIGLVGSKNNSKDEIKRTTTSPSQEEPVSQRLDEVYTEEKEIHQQENFPLWTVSPNREFLRSRCVCVSNILRSLSFIPGNDLELSQHPGILAILGQLLMLHHVHVLKNQSKQSKHKHHCVDQEEEPPEKATFLPIASEWWWATLDVLRENTLVMLSNISGQLDLSIYPEAISYPIIDGLLHWAVCPSSQAGDPLPESAMVPSLSPQRLVLETLAKMSILEANVDFILATPPLARLDLLFSCLVQWIGQKRHPVVRQFALVLLSNLAQGDQTASRLVCQQKLVVSLLLECLETAEQLSVQSGHLNGRYSSPDDPNSLSVAMLRRAAATLHCLAKVPENRTAFLPHRDRLLYLSTSQYVEPSVSSFMMDMLFELGKL